ncbi:hypothetical protein MPC4_70068 [Methylocella tundrae]|uniref:Uncharacterized protein n=1 Tax=Methylocella tundrae TaxID=227605 RepID=A0A8B6MB17_METTU|nr:hypothetical protein [Methylocella tundrae]VTZ27244.1 hypothetical protein MPC1_50013 [Methylocella tundrae]VTZ52180.1 hypothetical protein MPC4_70068 [Methylocella tundrae]
MNLDSLEAGILSNCKPGELIKLKLGEQIYLAIVTEFERTPSDYRPIVILNRPDSPFIMNAADYGQVIVLRYGDRYGIRVDQHSEFFLGQKAESRKSGLVLMAQSNGESRAYLRADVTGVVDSIVRFYDFQDGILKSQAGVHRVTLTGWSIWLENSYRESVEHSAIFSFGTSDQAVP